MVFHITSHRKICSDLSFNCTPVIFSINLGNTMAMVFLSLAFVSQLI